MKKVKWTKNALRNLNNEVDYIGIDNPQAAKNVAAFIRRTVNLLETMPEMGRQGKKEGTRELVIKKLPYFVRYKVKEKHIEILNVFHTARKLRG